MGSAGGIDPSVHVRDVVAGMGACTDSKFAAQCRLPGSVPPLASEDLLADERQSSFTQMMEIALSLALPA